MGVRLPPHLLMYIIIETTTAPPAVQPATSEPECKFYVIWCPESDKPIKNKYTLSRAIKVIAKMRAKYPDSTFHIMEKVDE